MQNFLGFRSEIKEQRHTQSSKSAYLDNHFVFLQIRALKFSYCSALPMCFHDGETSKSYNLNKDAKIWGVWGSYLRLALYAEIYLGFFQNWV